MVADSRKVESHPDIFWALSGPNYDGAYFLHEAFRGSARKASWPHASRPSPKPLLDDDAAGTGASDHRHAEHAHEVESRLAQHLYGAL